MLGLDGHYTRALQQHVSRLAADVSFAKAREHLMAMLPVTLSKEALRRACHRHGQRMAEWQPQETATPGRRGDRGRRGGVQHRCG
jgi:hypothetical protein